MRKIFYNWAGAAIVALAGVGADFMPSNDSWWPSIICWTIASIWLIGTLIYWCTHKDEIMINTKKEAIEKIPFTLQALYDREKQIALDLIEEHKKTGWEAMGRTMLDVFEAISLDIEEVKKAIAEPYQKGDKKRTIDQARGKLFQAEYGDNPQKLAELVFTAMDKNGVGIAPYAEKDKRYKEIITNLNKQQNAIATENITKAIRIFKIKAYEINSVYILGQSFMDKPVIQAPMDGILDIQRRMGLADDEISKYMALVTKALDEYRQVIVKG